MTKSNAKGMSAAGLRTALGVALVLLIAAGIGAYLFGYSQVSKYSAEVQTKKAEAEASKSIISNLIQVQKQLITQSDMVDKASGLVAQAEYFKYQDQIINELSDYANLAGIEIENINFADTSTGTATTTPPAAGAPATGTATTTVPGVKAVTASIAISNPVRYADIMQFLNYLEQSLFRMSILSVSMSRAESESGQSMVNSDVLTLEVYVKGDT